MTDKEQQDSGTVSFTWKNCVQVIDSASEYKCAKPIKK